MDINRYPQFSWPLRSLSKPLHPALNRKLSFSIAPTIVNINNNEDRRLGLEALGAVLKVSHFVCVWYFDNVSFIARTALCLIKANVRKRSPTVRLI